VSNYQTRTLGAAANFGIPITETDTINVGLRYENTDITLFDDSPLAYKEYVAQFGNPTNVLIFTSGWARDTRDDILYPTRGRLQSLLLEVGLPFGDINYYKAQYVQQWFTPLVGDLVLMLRGDIGYGSGYSGSELPFYKAFYAGGVGSVRGYEQSSLGPRDAFGNVTGGKRKIVANAELFYPILKGEKSVRASVFADAGQIYLNSNYNKIADVFYPDSDLQGFRYTAGVGLAWNSPIGPLKFSYALPLNDKPGDRLQAFQFQVGSVF
jgi:outer membrane protein insertion porin family